MFKELAQALSVSESKENRRGNGAERIELFRGRRVSAEYSVFVAGDILKDY